MKFASATCGGKGREQPAHRVRGTCNEREHVRFVTERGWIKSKSQKTVCADVELRSIVQTWDGDGLVRLPTVGKPQPVARSDCCRRQHRGRAPRSKCFRNYRCYGNRKEKVCNGRIWWFGLKIFPGALKRAAGRSSEANVSPKHMYVTCPAVPTLNDPPFPSTAHVPLRNTPMSLNCLCTHLFKFAANKNLFQTDLACGDSGTAANSVGNLRTTMSAPVPRVFGSISRCGD